MLFNTQHSYTYRNKRWMMTGHYSHLLKIFVEHVDSYMYSNPRQHSSQHSQRDLEHDETPRKIRNYTILYEEIYLKIWENSCRFHQDSWIPTKILDSSEEILNPVRSLVSYHFFLLTMQGFYLSIYGFHYITMLNCLSPVFLIVTGFIAEALLILFFVCNAV